MCLWGATLAFGAGFAAVSINGATVNKFPKLTPGEKSFLSTVPSITGSFFRIPLGMHVGTFFYYLKNLFKNVILFNL